MSTLCDEIAALLPEAVDSVEPVSLLSLIHI